MARWLVTRTQTIVVEADSHDEAEAVGDERSDSGFAFDTDDIEAEIIQGVKA